MRGNTIRWVVLMAALSIVGIVITQIYWVSTAWNLKDQQFKHRVDLALNDVVERVVEISNDSTLLVNPVSQVSGNQYNIELNEPIDPSIAGALLVSAFEEYNIQTDFEFGIYDCIADTILTGPYMRFKENYQPLSSHVRHIDLPKSQQSYFSVKFPQKDRYILSAMGFWLFSSAILAFVIVFFAYTTFIILRQKRMSEVTRDFINNMTHELKTPISTIAVSADVLASDEIERNPKRRKRYSGIIKQENERLKKQVEKVLQIATLEKDEIQINKESVDVHQLIKKLVNSMRVSLESNGGRISVRLKAEKAVIQADKVHLMNILYNLVDNAIKYSGDNPPDIIIETGNERNCLIVKVKDRGIGMDRNEMRMIFKKFYRVPTGNRHDVKGFGLGLAYVKMMMEKHHGKIKVESEKGAGSEFTLILPFK